MEERGGGRLESREEREGGWRLESCKARGEGGRGLKAVRREEREKEN